MQSSFWWCWCLWIRRARKWEHTGVWWWGFLWLWHWRLIICWLPDDYFYIVDWFLYCLLSYSMGMVKKSWTLILSKGLWTLSTPKSDQLRNSSYNFNWLPSRQVIRMRIKQIMILEILTWNNTKFLENQTRRDYQVGELAFISQEWKGWKIGLIVWQEANIRIHFQSFFSTYQLGHCGPPCSSYFKVMYNVNYLKSMFGMHNEVIVLRQFKFLTDFKQNCISNSSSY